MKTAKLSPMTSFLMSLMLVAGIFVAGITNSRVLPAAKAQSIQQVSVGGSNATLAGSLIAVKGVVINGVASDAFISGSVRISNSVVDSGCGFTALGSTATGDIVYALGVFTSGNDTDPTGPNGVFTSGNDTDPPIGPNGVFTSGNDTDPPTVPNGVFTSGNDTDPPVGPNGVFTSGNDTDPPVGPNGVFTSGNDTDLPTGPNGVFTSGNVYVGSSLQVVGGVLSGSNIQITDGIISGSNLRITGGYVTSACGQ